MVEVRGDECADAENASRAARFRGCAKRVGITRSSFFAFVFAVAFLL